MTNPIEILRKGLPAVLTKKKAFIVSTIEKPTERHKYYYYRRNSGTVIPKTKQRICYYIKNTKSPAGINFNCIGIFSEYFSLRNEKDPDIKYEIVGDFLSDPNSLIDYNCDDIHRRRKQAVLHTLKYFDKKHDLIDTIVVVDNEPLGKNPKIIYDRTGKLDVAEHLLSKTKYQKRKRLLAEISGDPKALKEQGYFDEPFKEQTEKPLKREEPIDEFTRLSIFDFGKKRSKVSLRSLMADIKYLKNF